MEIRADALKACEKWDEIAYILRVHYPPAWPAWDNAHPDAEQRSVFVRGPFKGAVALYCCILLYSVNIL